MLDWSQNLQYEVWRMNVKRKLIIAVDFDGTLSSAKWPDVGDALHKAIEWCKEFNLVFDAVNDNLPEIKELYGSNSRIIATLQMKSTGLGNKNRI